MSMSHSGSKPTCVVCRQSEQYECRPPSSPASSSTAWRSKAPLSLGAPGRSPSKLARECVNKKEPSQYSHLCGHSCADSMSGFPGLSTSLQAARHTSLATSLPKSIAPSSWCWTVNARKGRNASSPKGHGDEQHGPEDALN